MRKNILFLGLILVIVISAYAFNVALMITGEVGGNPIYEMMVACAKRSGELNGYNVKVVEGGYNASKWEQTLISLVATMQYDVVVTFTEGMPQSVERAAKMFPAQKLLLVDGIAPEMDNVFSLGFKDEEMSYLAGYFAGLVTDSKMENANDQLKVALVAGDTYPAMTNKMKPAFEKGVSDANDKAETFFTVAGSWSDPGKGKDIAAALFSQGVDVVYGIAGGTSAGIIQEADAQKKYFIGVDSNIIHINPEVILACTLKKADIALEKTLTLAYKGELTFGTTERWGIDKGVIDFTFDDPYYLEQVPLEIREAMLQVFEGLKNGEISPL